MKRTDATAALSWADNTRATSDTRITAIQYRILSVIAGGCETRARIAAAAGCGESTVPRAVRRLEKVGALKRTIGAPGKANTYEVLVRSDTGIARDTGITTTRVASKTRIAKVRESGETGATSETGQTENAPRAHIEHAPACAAPVQTITLPVEDYTETVVLVEAVVAREPAPHILNGAAKSMPAHLLADKLIEIANSPWLLPNTLGLSKTVQEIRGWITDECDFDQDIVPTVIDLCARYPGKRPLTTWKYFSGAVRDAALTRIALEERARNPITLEEANAHVQHAPRNRNAGPDYGRGKSNHHTDELLRDILDGPPHGDGRMDFYAGK